MIPKYDKHERQAIQNLPSAASRVFGVIECEEKGTIVDVKGLCSCLTKGATLVLFSCLSGNGRKEEFGQDLGTLFVTRLKGRAETLFSLLRGAGYEGSFCVIVDDTEPSRVWQWKIGEQDSALWYRMVIEDAKIPLGWEVKLWSDIESAFTETSRSRGYLAPGVSSFDEYLSERRARGPSHNAYRLLEHMKQFPNKKLREEEVSLKEVALRRAVQCKWQGMVISQFISNPVLIQTETPWAVKDPLLYHPLGNSFHSILHPFAYERM